MNSNSSDAIKAPLGLATGEYLRERLFPRAGDPLYLHLSDLRIALGEVLPMPSAKVLDYGCGGSPYRELFQASVYHRADIRGIEGLDYVFAADSKLEAPSDTYDCVLSTQVLEHVRDYRTYLAESRRVLRVGGKLVLTTHGVYPDHGCPYDFRRWTADGLAQDCSEAGFNVLSVKKLTTGPRALAFMNQHHHQLMVVSDRSPMALLWRLGRLPYRVNRKWADIFCDKEFSNNRVVPAFQPESGNLYIALMTVAVRAS